MTDISDYRELIGGDAVDRLQEKSERLMDKHLLMVNSTSNGGGVAEMLNSMIPIMNRMGMKIGWRVLHGFPDFFDVTKSFHNGLQGGELDLTDEVKQIYLKANRDFSSFTHIDHDAVVIHDPQPLPMIEFHEKKQPWIWRLHIDVSNPNPHLWHFLKGFIEKYDQMIISNEIYRKQDLSLKQRIIHPAIDPLTDKNVDMTDAEAFGLLERNGVPTDKPIIAQVSRFDIWKDPAGVIDVFRKVRERENCRLVMCGSMASDDPEGWGIYENVRGSSSDLLDSGDLIFMTNADDRLVNSLQRGADVIVQKSIKEGFGLTVTEALWKRTPVVTTRVGGIPLQVIDGENGYLLDPRDNRGFADHIIKLLRDRKLAAEMGERGREHVRNNFLITRLISDYQDLFTEVATGK
ncbi:MAG: glycosyltransferase [Thermoplasmatota archaeon]